MLACMTSEDTFSLFGYGEGGIPAEVDMWLSIKGEVEALAREVIVGCQLGQIERQQQGERRPSSESWRTS
jgi:hypothetical protein